MSIRVRNYCISEICKVAVGFPFIIQAKLGLVGAITSIMISYVLELTFYFKLIANELREVARARAQEKLGEKPVEAYSQNHFQSPFRDPMRYETVCRLSRSEVLGLLSEPLLVASVPDVERGEVLEDSRGRGTFQRVVEEGGGGRPVLAEISRNSAKGSYLSMSLGPEPTNECARANYTWFYAWNKIPNTKLIGDLTTRKIIKLIGKLKLSKPACLIAEKVSVILFICEKQVQPSNPKNYSLCARYQL